MLLVYIEYQLNWPVTTVTVTKNNRDHCDSHKNRPVTSVTVTKIYRDIRDSHKNRPVTTVTVTKKTCDHCDSHKKSVTTIKYILYFVYYSISRLKYSIQNSNINFFLELARLDTVIQNVSKIYTKLCILYNIKLIYSIQISSIHYFLELIR